MIRSVSIRRPYILDSPPRVNRIVIPYMVAYGAGVLELEGGGVTQATLIAVPPTPPSTGARDIICTTHQSMSANRSFIHC